jgi:uncharacterized protein with FMN-binding domain
VRRATATVLAAAALALPNANAWAAATAAKAAPKKKVVTKTRTFTGAAAQADRWGSLQVTIVMKKTTITNLATKKKTVKRRITAVRAPVYPNHTDRSIFINQQALPTLISETIRAQSSRIDMVSGATDTSGAFQQSLDPHTHRAPDGVLSVTITGPDLATADAFATAAFAWAAKGPAWTVRLRGYEAMTLLADGRSLCTPGFPSVS